jgi:hypothetical protein
MNSLQINVDVPNALRETIALLSDTPDGRRTINTSVGEALADLTRQHLYDIDAQRHRPNVAHRYYATAADSTIYELLSDGVSLRISQVGFAQRRFGGTIRPVNAKALTIPIDPEAEGKVASEFSDLIAIVNPTTRRGILLRTTDDKPLFALVQSVTQSPDPSILPTDAQYEDAAAFAIDLLIQTRSAATTSTRSTPTGA